MIIELLKLFLGYKIMFLNTWRGRYSLMPRVRTRVNPKKKFLGIEFDYYSKLFKDPSTIPNTLVVLHTQWFLASCLFLNYMHFQKKVVL